MKSCFTCKYFRKQGSYAFSAACLYPGRDRFGTGNIAKFADSARMEITDCGPDAKWHEPKPPTRTQRFLRWLLGD